MKQHKKLLIDLVFAAVILAAAAVLLLVRKANQTGAPLCAELIYGDSNTKLTFPLEKDADYDVDTGYLTVHIKIQDGAARFVDSPCPDCLKRYSADHNLYIWIFLFHNSQYFF